MVLFEKRRPPQHMNRPDGRYHVFANKGLSHERHNTFASTHSARETIGSLSRRLTEC